MVVAKSTWFQCSIFRDRS